jgi:hypothetical protein
MSVTRGFGFINIISKGHGTNNYQTVSLTILPQKQILTYELKDKINHLKVNKTNLHSGGHTNGAVLDFAVTLWSLFITCKQDIYNYVPATSHVPAAPLLQLQFMVHIMLFPTLKAVYFYIITSSSMCAVSITAIFCCSPMLFTFLLNVFEMAPVAPVITAFGFVFHIPHALHFPCIRSLHFKIFWASFVI